MASSKSKGNATGGGGEKRPQQQQQQPQLWTVISDHSDLLLQDLDSNGKTLSALVKTQLLSQKNQQTLEKIKDREQRNAELLQMILENESRVTNSYDRFIDALNDANQKKLTSRLTNADQGRDAGQKRGSEPRQTEQRSPPNNGPPPPPPPRQQGRNDERHQVPPAAAGNRNRRGDGEVDNYTSDSNGRRDDGRGGPPRGPGQAKNGGRGPPSGPNAVYDRGPGDRDRDRDRDRDGHGREYESSRDRSPNRRPDEYGDLNGDDRDMQTIDKLRRECDDIARKHADVFDKLRQVDHIVHQVHPVGVATDGRRHGENVNGDVHPTTRKQQDEAERHVISVRDHVSAINDDLKDTDQSAQACESIVDRLRDEIAERNMAFLQMDRDNDYAFQQRQNDPQPSPPDLPGQRPLPGTTHHMTPEGAAKANGTRRSRLGQLQSKMANLAAEMEAYIHREKQHTMVPRWPGKEPGPHRNFDQIDHDFGLLQRELRQNDRQSAVVAVQRLADVTRTEREDCIRLCDDIQRVVQKRRTKIQELLLQYQKHYGKNGQPTFEPVKTSPVLQRKVRTSRSVESNVSRRLVELGDEIKLCIELEFDYNQKVRDDFARRRIDSDEQTKAIALETKRLERRAREAETERDRFRRLYEQLQAVQMSRLLTKPTVVKRSTGGKGHKGRRALSVDHNGFGVRLPTINTSHDENPIPSQSFFVGNNKGGRQEKDSDVRGSQGHEEVDDEDESRLHDGYKDGVRTNHGGVETDRRNNETGHHHEPGKPQMAVHLQTSKAGPKLSAHYDEPVYFDGTETVSPRVDQPHHQSSGPHHNQTESGSNSKHHHDGKQSQQHQKGLIQLVKESVDQVRKPNGDKHQQQQQQQQPHYNGGSPQQQQHPQSHYQEPSQRHDYGEPFNDSGYHGNNYPDDDGYYNQRPSYDHNGNGYYDDRTDGQRYSQDVARAAMDVAEDY